MSDGYGNFITKADVMLLLKHLPNFRGFQWKITKKFVMNETNSKFFLHLRLNGSD